MNANELNLARAAGTVAGIDGSDPTSCPWPAGELRDAWMAAFHDAGEPLHKVMPAGGPLIPGHPDYPMPYTECPRCSLRALPGHRPPNCPAAEDLIGDCPLKSAP
jgi:ribosome modulation factor